MESGIVMEERLEEFIRKLKNRHYNSKTIETYQNLLKHFMSFYEKHIIAGNTVRERDIERFIQYLKNKNLKSTTIKAILRISKKFIEFTGGRWEGDTKEIYRERDTVESANPFSELQLKQIFNYLHDNNKIYYYLSLTLYGFGLRISEALSLKPQDFIETNGKIFIKVRPEISKFNRDRLSPLILKDRCREDLIDFIATRNNKKLKEYPLFTYYNDIQKRIITIKPKTAEIYYHRLSKELDIHIHPHRFRDSYISYLISKGIKPLTVSKWAGHSNISTTLKFYAKLTTKDELEELEKVW